MENHKLIAKINLTKTITVCGLRKYFVDVASEITNNLSNNPDLQESLIDNIPEFLDSHSYSADAISDFRSKHSNSYNIYIYIYMI